MARRGVRVDNVQRQGSKPNVAVAEFHTEWLRFAKEIVYEQKFVVNGTVVRVPTSSIGHTATVED